MRENFAALQGFLAFVDGFDKPAFLIEIPRQDFLHEFVGIAALLSGGLREFRFQFGQDRTGKRQASFSSVTEMSSRCVRELAVPFRLNRSEHFQAKMSSWPSGLWNSLRALWISARSTVPL
jgi:hypothetical protein